MMRRCVNGADTLDIRTIDPLPIGNRPSSGQHFGRQLDQSGVIPTRTVDYQFRPNVMVIGSMLSELAIAPALQDLIDALASLKCGKVTVVSRPFPSIVDDPKNGLRLIALPQVLSYHGKWR